MNGHFNSSGIQHDHENRWKRNFVFVFFMVCNMSDFTSIDILFFFLPLNVKRRTGQGQYRFRFTNRGSQPPTRLTHSSLFLKSHSHQVTLCFISPCLSYASSSLHNCPFCLKYFTDGHNYKALHQSNPF